MMNGIDAMILDFRRQLPIDPFPEWQTKPTDDPDGSLGHRFDQCLPKQVTVR